MTAVAWIITAVASMISLILGVVLSKQSRQTSTAAKLLDQRAEYAHTKAEQMREQANAAPVVEPVVKAAEDAAKAKAAAVTLSADPYGADPFAASYVADRAKPLSRREGDK